METLNVEVSEYALDRFNDNVKKLNKKAVKAGFEPITVEFVSERMIDIKPFDGLLVSPKIKLMTYAVSGENLTKPLQIEGYTLIGKIDATQEFPIYTGSELPESHKDLLTKKSNELYCEHCNTKRRRNTYYVIKTPEDEVKTIGSTCIKLYTGIDKIDAILNMRNSIFDFFEDDYGYGSGSSADQYFSIKVILERAITVYIVDKAYMKSSEGPDSTASKTLRVFNMYNKEFDEYYEELKKDHSEFINRVIDYWSNIETGSNTYELNVLNIFKNGYVKFNQIGFIASAILPIIKEDQRKVENKNKLNEYYGNVGDKFKADPVSLTVVKILSFSNDFGYSYKVLFEDKEGRTFVWSTANEKGLEVGSKVTINGGSIKAHKEYNGIKQTMITRIKFFG